MRLTISKSIILASVFAFACFAMPHSAVLAQTTTDTNQTTSSSTEVQTSLTPLQQAVRDRLSKLPANNKAQIDRARRIGSWYEKRNYEPLWVMNGKPTAAAERITLMLIKAYEDGLDPSEYGGMTLFSKSGAHDAAALADFEITMANAAVLYGQHLHSGRVEPSKVNRELILYPEQIVADTLLDKLAEGGRSASNLAALAPNTDRYARLKNHLNALRLAEASGPWTIVPEGEVIKEGMENVRIPQLRKRLEQSGDLPAGAHVGMKLDGNLLKALRYFQYRMGLEADGAVGPATLAQLNTSLAERIKQVELNLERRRWMQADFGERYIFVNLADQVLKLVDKEKTVHAAVVQVGLPYHATPVFTETMEYLDFNPYWNVPYSIATKEYLPMLKRNANALRSKNIRVLRGDKEVDPASVPWSSYSRGRFPVRLRQDPGPDNALGRVKFMFPNKYNIYIHDTPAKSKFAQASRYFSHGCIRVRDPFALAQNILSVQGISRGEIDSIVRSQDRKIIRLKQKIPVHVAYLTAWVNKDGSVHYRRDIYGRDKILAAALEKKGS